MRISTAHFQVFYLFAFICFFFLSVFQEVTYAGEESWDVDDYLLQEDFEESFPPSGWEIITTNDDHTWQQGDENTEGVCNSTPDGKFAYVQGDPDSPYDLCGEIEFFTF